MIYIKIPQKAEKILEVLHGNGYEAYVVGGCVRDSILGREPGDWDITTSASPQEVKSLFPRTIDTGIEHGTVTVMDGKEGFEVTTYRIDGDQIIITYNLLGQEYTWEQSFSQSGNVINIGGTEFEK